MVREWVFIILVKGEDGRLPTQNIWHCCIGRNALYYRKCRGAVDTPFIIKSYDRNWCMGGLQVT